MLFVVALIVLQETRLPKIYNRLRNHWDEDDYPFRPIFLAI